MLEYFPTNYAWNLSTNIALLMGGNIGEVDAICRKLTDAAKGADDSGTVAFFEAWCEQADRLVELAEEDVAAGRKLSAGAKYGRAATYAWPGAQTSIGENCKSGALPAKAIARCLTTGNMCSGSGARSRSRSSWSLRRESR
jgi:hypothetical protein